jgi:hypothetical protein
MTVRRCPLMDGMEGAHNPVAATTSANPGDSAR